MTATHPDATAFMRAICADPADDTARLVYADWLEEHAGDGKVCPRCGGRGLVKLGVEKKGGPFDGDHFKRHVFEPQRGTFDWGCDGCGGRGAEPGTGRVSNGFIDRAEFIRVQVELSRFGKEPSCECQTGPARHGCPKAKWDKLRRREQGLWDAHQREWVPVGFLGLTDTYRGCEFRRGFVAAVTCTAADWLRVCDGLAWSPGQRDRCPNRCFLSAKHGVRICRDVPGKRCDLCEKGTVSRPFPPTAQPIEAVTLTTMPELEWVNGNPQWGGGAIYRMTATTFESRKWSGIVFHLPTPA